MWNKREKKKERDELDEFLSKQFVEVAIVGVEVEDF